MHSLLLIFAALAMALGASAQSVNWVQYIDPSDKNDQAFGVCLFGDYLAVMGDAFGDKYIALLDRTTGRIVKTWKGGLNPFFNCLSVGDRLYAIGMSERGGGVIYIFDKGLNVVKKVETVWTPSNAISFDGSYLYLADGIERDVDGDGHKEPIWRIEKRTLDLNLVGYKEFYREFELYRKWERDRENARLYLGVSDIEINPATGDLWAVGGGKIINIITSSLIVVLDKGLNVKRVVEYPKGHENYLDWLSGVCFDDGGNAYVVGGEGVAKFDKSGNILAVSKKVKEGRKIACIGGRVYIIGEKKVGNYWRQVLYVLDEGLSPLGELILSKDVEAHSFFSGGRPASDGRNLYAAGWDKALGEVNTRIDVYSISLPTGREVTTTAALNPGEAQTVETKTPSASLSSQMPILIAIAVVAAAAVALLKRRR